MTWPVNTWSCRLSRIFMKHISLCYLPCIDFFLLFYQFLATSGDKKSQNFRKTNSLNEAMGAIIWSFFPKVRYEMNIKNLNPQHILLWSAVIDVRRKTCRVALQWSCSNHDAWPAECTVTNVYSPNNKTFLGPLEEIRTFEVKLFWMHCK